MSLRPIPVDAKNSSSPIRFASIKLRVQVLDSFYFISQGKIISSKMMDIHKWTKNMECRSNYAEDSIYPAHADQ